MSDQRRARYHFWKWCPAFRQKPKRSLQISREVMMSCFKGFRRILAVLLFSMGGLVGTSASGAVILNVVNGVLVGASGISVAGFSNTFSVEFKDGTCVDVFSSCDNNTVFAFSNYIDAAAASQALLDQVLVGTFDESPSFTLGCAGQTQRCDIETPYDARARTTNYSEAVDYAVAINRRTIDGRPDVVAVSSHSPTTDGFGENWAIWSVTSPNQVPEPSALSLAGVSLLGIGLTRRRRARGLAG